MSGKFRWIVMAAALAASWAAAPGSPGQASMRQLPAANAVALQSLTGDHASKDLEGCRVHPVKSLPGSHQFGSEFIVALATEPDAKGAERNDLWALTADLSKQVPALERAMYLSKSIDGGATWVQVARVDSSYFDAKIGEGLRDGLAVSPGGKDFVITTQRGAFQVFPQSGTSDAVLKPIEGPKVPHPRPRLNRPKKAGDAIMAGVVRMTPDGERMVVGYGYFDLKPQILTYRRADDGSWIEDKPLLHLPTDLDILSMEFSDPSARSLYVGTGDQAFRLDMRTMKWNRITGVGPDSAIHSISVVGGPHLAACWGVYNPVSADAVKRLTDARFLLHRFRDEVGPNLRAYGIEVDPSHPNRQVVTSITGAYTSEDAGRNWKRLNDLPDGEYRSAHINPDGSVIVSGIPGTFLATPFSSACSPHLQTR